MGVTLLGCEWHLCSSLVPEISNGTRIHFLQVNNKILLPTDSNAVPNSAHSLPEVPPILLWH